MVTSYLKGGNDHVKPVSREETLKFPETNLSTRCSMECSRSKKREEPNPSLLLLTDLNID